ncbi:MAG: SRPBCC family protein [Planctomycetota bacterium]
MQMTVTQQINAPIETVFQLLTEPEQVRRWMPTLESTETVSTPDDGSVVGTRFRQRIRSANQAGSTVTTYEGVITEYEPPDRFAVRVGSSVILMEGRYELTRGPGDSTDLQYVAEARVTHWLLRWFGWLMDKAMQLGMTQHLQSLKRVAESDVA